jgi:bifunctional NMN adenylyltransferase/nudix hydrolase
MHDVFCFALRGRPYGPQHEFNILQGLEIAQYGFIFIGSAEEPINFRNAFTAAEVAQMIRGSLTAAQNDRIFIFAVEDQDSDPQWATLIQRLTAETAATLSLGHPPRVTLVGHAKDHSSYYLKLFPQWESYNTPNFGNNMSATDLRHALYNATDPMTELSVIHARDRLPIGTFTFLRQWVRSPAFERMRDEYLFNVKEDAKYGPHPYRQVHIHATADYCLMQSGAVLLVRRGEMPGKGQWALPGGHIGDHERFRDAAVRELCEETSILELNSTLDKGDLYAAIKAEKVYDDPWRSTRMRTIDMAYGGILHRTTRPLVEGTDDAEAARWWNLDEVVRSMMFEDHYNMIQFFSQTLR